MALRNLIFDYGLQDLPFLCNLVNKILYMTSKQAVGIL